MKVAEKEVACTINKIFYGLKNMKSIYCQSDFSKASIQAIKTSRKLPSQGGIMFHRSFLHTQLPCAHPSTAQGPAAQR